MIKTENLTVTFGGLKALDNVNFQVNEEKIHSIIGPNGAGKTTLFNAISGIVDYDGKIYVNGKEISKLLPHERIKAGIGRSFQNIMIFEYLTVLENLMVGFHKKLKYGFFQQMMGMKKFISEERKAFFKAIDIADILDLKGYLNTYAGNLPYGKQRIVDIARALMTEPKILLLDEPAAGLNDMETENLKEILRKISSMNIKILLVEHDMRLVMDISEEITVLNFGKIIATGKPEEIKQNKKVIEAYLGIEEKSEVG